MIIHISNEQGTTKTATHEISFDVPPGIYRARLVRVTSKTAKDNNNKVRLVFEIPSLSNPNVEYQAGKDYDPTLASGSKLRKDLKSWRGHDLTREETASKSVDLETLIGREADIEIAHIHNPDYPKPFVHLPRICPPGTLIKPPETQTASNNAACQSKFFYDNCAYYPHGDPPSHYDVHG